jgi:hypothetical protein
MIRIALFILFVLFTTAASAQQIGYNVGVGVRKTFNIKKKSSLDIRQQFQLTPEIERYEGQFGDFFNEEGFWPVPDRYQTSDDDDDNNNAGGDDDDDDDDDLPPGAGPGIPDNSNELNDLPTNIEWDWRSTTSAQYNYRFKPWLRANAGYALFFNGEEFRHTLRTELDYRPLRHTKSKKKVDIATRVMYQRVANYDEDDAEWEWDASLTPRFDTEWTFKKNHILTISPALNGIWEDEEFMWDRWRVNTSLAYIYKKMHRFSFAYQFQQRLDKPRKSHGFSLGYEIRL